MLTANRYKYIRPDGTISEVYSPDNPCNSACPRYRYIFQCNDLVMTSYLNLNDSYSTNMSFSIETTRIFSDTQFDGHTTGTTTFHGMIRFITGTNSIGYMLRPLSNLIYRRQSMTFYTIRSMHYVGAFSSIVICTYLYVFYLTDSRHNLTNVVLCNDTPPSSYDMTSINWTVKRLS